MLWADFLTNRGRLIHKCAHYFPIYEEHLTRFVNRPVLLVEIGVARGGSLQMWKRFLGPLATIVGIDINPGCRAVEEDQIHVRIGSQADTGFLGDVLAEFGVPDIVIDDGSHIMNDVNTTFAFLYSRIAAHGVYLVEDLQTAYWDRYGGGVKREGTFIEHCKDLIDQLNAYNTEGVLAPTDFTRTTTSMHIYDAVVVFEKGKHAPYRAVKTGGKSVK